MWTHQRYRQEDCLQGLHTEATPAKLTALLSQLGVGEILSADVVSGCERFFSRHKRRPQAIKKKMRWKHFNMFCALSQNYQHKFEKKNDIASYCIKST